MTIAGQMVNLTGSGPKLLLSKQAVSSGVITWKWKNLGNNAIEFGVVCNADLSDAAMHKSGKTGFYSANTSGSVLPLKIPLKDEVVEIVCDVSKGAVRYTVGDSEHHQSLAMTGWQQGDPVRLAVTLWAGGKVQLMPSPEVDMSTVQAHSFIPAEFQHPVVQVSAGLKHICLVSQEGRVYGAGLNNSGQCGKRSKKPAANANGKEEEIKVSTPQEIPLPDDVTVCKVTCGSLHSAVLTIDGRVFTFGSNTSQQLGRPDVKGTESDTPGSVPLPPNTKAIDVAAYGSRTLVLLSDKRILAFGGEAPTPSVVTSFEAACIGTPSSISFSEDAAYITCKESSVAPSDLDHAFAAGSERECVVLIPSKLKELDARSVRLASGGIKSIEVVPAFNSGVCVCDVPSHSATAVLLPHTRAVSLHSSLIESCPTVWGTTQKRLGEVTKAPSDAAGTLSAGAASMDPVRTAAAAASELNLVDLGAAAEKTARLLLAPMSALSSAPESPCTSSANMGAAILSLLAAFSAAQPLISSIREAFSPAGAAFCQPAAPFLNIGGDHRVQYGQWDDLVFTTNKAIVLSGLRVCGHATNSVTFLYRVTKKGSSKPLVSGEEAVFGTARPVVFASAIVLQPNTTYVASAALKPPPLVIPSDESAAATKRPIAKETVDEILTDDGVTILFPSIPANKASNVVGLLCTSCDNLMAGIYKDLEFLRGDLTQSISHVGLASLFDGLEQILRSLRNAHNSLDAASRMHFLETLGSTCLKYFEQNLLSRFHVDSLGMHSEMPKGASRL